MSWVLHIAAEGCECDYIQPEFGSTRRYSAEYSALIALTYLLNYDGDSSDIHGFPPFFLLSVTPYIYITIFLEKNQ
jgi:hypothetical protein